MRQRSALVISFLLLPVVAVLAPAQTLEPLDPDAARKKPITTVGGPVGELLKKWWQEGTAAGNVGDYYDNRDGDHSPLNRLLSPQLRMVQYSAADIKLRKHWAAQSIIHPAVVFGNSSTSAPPTHGGSNPRHYYVAGRGIAFLSEQYAHNNIYIYPEHRDHDPGHNGKGDGYGDLYPTNTPYLLISQGSSGSDQPFMRAIPLTLAAFRPKVKKQLTEAGALMPTLQMILRSTGKQLKRPEDYLTGKAHPSVFEGGWIDELALVKLAHDMEPKSLPPLVRIKTVEEDAPARAGIDYFEAGVNEKLADTPQVIARVHRSKERTRRLVVSAEESRDLNQAPLTYRWVILRGDPERIQIKPRNPAGSVAEITVAYHERRPIAPGSPMESNRVDIGVFVHNGAYYSAPAFITFTTYDSEARSYDAKGRIVEIGYGMGVPELGIHDWSRVLKALITDGPAGKLFGIDPTRRKALTALTQRYAEAQQRLADAEVRVKTTEAQEKDAADKAGARKQTEAARRERSQLQQKATALLAEPQTALGGVGLRAFVESTAQRLARDPGFVTGSKSDSQAALRQQLTNLGVLPPKPEMTAFDRAHLEHLGLALLADSAFAGAATAAWQPNFVDRRLSTPKDWRDVYHYDAQDQCVGWTRYYRERTAEDFNHEGLLVVEKDELGRCKKGRVVRYSWTASRGFDSTNPLRMELGDEYVTYTFRGADDRRGIRAGMERTK